MSQLGGVVSWLLGLFMLIVAASLHETSPIMALFALLGMAFILPPTARSLASKLAIAGRFKQVAIGLALGLLGGPMAAAIVGGFTAPTDSAQMALSQQESAAQKAEAARLRQEAAMAELVERRAKEAEAAELKRLEKCNDTIAAFVMSQQFVTEALRSPSTADFPYITAPGVKSIASGDCKFKVFAYVDSQNGYGATVRTKYVIEMEYLPAKGAWRASNLRM